ncbi:histidine--tRNA ligase [Candidatus Woesearchaeota archaeon CG10_big_fil_rev_8_21_14_0_10_32_24]|nr:MAG: histidine--tRNA ligase [Candidatus Woesearchaeota archaeon CG10_big_fil_rev_8_21_14_0_10_32_24]
MKMQTAKGVFDTPPEEKIIKNQVLNTLTEVFELYGFAPLETPVIERFETLAAKSGAGEESDALKETFQLTDQGKRKLGLRFEFTTSLARYMAMNTNIKMPFKRYEFGPVFRDGPIKLGRYRQFWQCDVDTVGTSSMLADAECIAIISTAFQKLNFDFEIKINNRKILNGIMTHAGIKEQKEALIAIDKLDKIGKEGVAKELEERGYKKSQIDKLFELILGKVTLTSLKKNLTDPEGIAGLNELEELFSYLKKMNVKEAVFDISLARGQAYYTGTVIEAYLKKSKINSSIAGGGRFDDMIGGFIGGGRIVPAVGVSFGLAPIMDAIKMKQDLKIKTPAKVFVLPINALEESLEIVQELRNAGINTDISLGKKGVSNNLQYAAALGIPYVVIFGEKELAQKKVRLRDMVSGKETLLTVKEVIKKLTKK